MKRLGMIILEHLFKRNFELSHKIYKSLLKKIEENEITSETNAFKYDNILSCMNLLPGIYKTVQRLNPQNQSE